MSVRSLLLLGTAAGVFAAFLPGCRKVEARPWEIVADNKSQKTCEVYVDIGSGARVNAPAMSGGERRVLLTGTADLTVRAVRVVYHRKDQTFTSGVQVPLGKRFVIAIDINGGISTSVADVEPAG